MSHRHLTLAVLIAMLVVPFRTALASIEATPFMGAMVPANSLLLETSGSSYVRMQTHTVYGLDLSKPLTKTIGAELVLGTGTGKMEIVGGSTALALGSTLFFADLRGRIRLLGGDQSDLAGVLGVGYTDFNVGLFDLAHETNLGTILGRMTGVAGAELRHDLAERARLKVSLVDRVHVSGVSLNGLGTSGVSEKTQNDLMVTAGLTFGL